MIRLARHIEILLLGNECVIVPDFGGFVAHRVNAVYDDSDELFLPPMRVLGFNPQLKINDSLLAQSYVEAYDLSYPDAVSTVADEVAELRHTLADYGRYELNGLGVLYYDSEGKLNFEPFEGGLLTPEFYALASFDMPMLHEVRNLHSGEDSEYGEDNSTNHAKIVYIGGESGHKTLNISLRAVRNLSVAAVILAAVFIVAFPIVTGRQGLVPGNVESGFYEMFNPAHKTAANGNSVAMSAVKQPSMSRQKSVAKVAAVSPKPHTGAVVNDANKPWSIVVCTHVGRSNAEQLAEKLRSAGFDDVYVETNGAVKVLYGHFETIEEAHKRLNELVGNDYFKDAWLLKVKK